MEIYYNLLGEEITKQEANAIGNYDRAFIENNEEKKVERFFKNSIACVFYYLNDTENPNQLVRELSFRSLVVLFRKIQSNGDLTLFDARGYKDGILESIGESVLDSNHDYYYSKDINMVTGLVEKYEKVKYADNGDMIYLFEYDSLGRLEIINDFTDDDTRTYFPNTWPANQLDWGEFQYYLSASPVFP